MPSFSFLFSQAGVSPRVLTTECVGVSRARFWCPTLVTALPRQRSTCSPMDSERSSSTMSRYVVCLLRFSALDNLWQIIHFPNVFCFRNWKFSWWWTADTVRKSPTRSHLRSARTLSSVLVNSPSSWPMEMLASVPKRTSKIHVYILKTCKMFNVSLNFLTITHLCFKHCVYAFFCTSLNINWWISFIFPHSGPVTTVLDVFFNSWSN